MGSERAAGLAIDGGEPVRRGLLPYATQSIDDDDVAAVAAVLRSGWLTTGPEVDRFEERLAGRCGVAHAVAVSSGTAALHTAYAALGVRPGDEVIVPAMTFAATANAAVWLGARPVFADVLPDTLLVDPASVGALCSPATRLIVGVDYGGQPCDYATLGSIAEEHGAALAADACHSLGGAAAGRPCGSLAAVSALSFHPVKHIAAGEGGAAVTDDADTAAFMRRFRNHGIGSDHRQRAERGSWFYEMTDLGLNYRLSDLQCALASSQLARLDGFLTRRRAIAAAYREAFADLPAVVPLVEAPGVDHAYHLFVVRLPRERWSVDRGQVFAALRAEGIGVNVHYVPVHLHPYYRATFGTGPGRCPVAEAAYEEIVSLPMFPAMTDADVADVVAAVRKVAAAYAATE